MERCPTTKQQYLVIGAGFVGKRLVQYLLNRGEDRVRVFDLMPLNPWQGDARVEYIVGDVTTLKEIEKACQGAETVYCTFAIIRFMDAFDWQADLSYNINVKGTENVLRACQQMSVQRLIVTSSSHATTDDDSVPRFGRDENSQLVTRETAHNHYGWTKAEADSLCLKTNGVITSNGHPLKIAIVRPCSGVFGAQDRFSFELGLNMEAYPLIGPMSTIDWVYVDNVILGHFLCEAALQKGTAGIAGEAFCISNEEPVMQQDFWWSVKKHHKDLGGRATSTFTPIHCPPYMWKILSTLSDWTQFYFRGRLSLGTLDILTRAGLKTAEMSYSYSSKKAREKLGYIPVFSLDEGIQMALHEYYNLKKEKED